MKTIKFSKRALCDFKERSRDTIEEIQDSENKYLRAIARPSGRSTLFVRKCPRNQRNAVKVTLPFSIDESMPDMRRIRSEASRIVAELDSGINPNQKPAGDGVLTLQVALDRYIKNSKVSERTKRFWRASLEQYLPKELRMPIEKLSDPDRLMAIHRRVMLEAAERNTELGRVGAGGIVANEVLKRIRAICNFVDESFQWPASRLRKLKVWEKQRPRTGRIRRE